MIKLVNLKYGTLPETTDKRIPLGLCYIGKVLKDNGYEVDYQDTNFEDVNLDNVTHLGMTVWTTGFPQAKELLDRAKAKGIICMAGGPHAYGDPQSLIDIGFDAVVQGDGEEVVCDIVENQKKGIFKGYVKSLDTLPVPDVEWSKKYPYIRVASILTTRGCPGKCIVEGSLIELADGRRLSVQDIESGMEVLGLDLASSTVRKQKVVASAKTSDNRYDIIHIETVNGILECTSDHEIWTQRGWVKAEELDGKTDVIATYVDLSDLPKGIPSGTISNRKGPQILLKEVFGDSPQIETDNTLPNLWQTPRTAKSILLKGMSEDEDSYNLPLVPKGIQQDQSSHRGQVLLNPLQGCISGPEQETQNDSRGSVATQLRTNESEQSYEQSRDTKKSQSGNFGPKRCSNRESKANESGRCIWPSCANERRGKGKIEPTHDCQQSHERPKGCGESCSTSKMAKLYQSKGNGGALDSCGGRSEQSRETVGFSDRPLGIQVCGRCDTLDRSMSEWEMSQSRLRIQERTQEDRDSSARCLLASEQGSGRNRDEGLPLRGLANVDYLGKGIERSGSSFDESQRLVVWSPILKLTHLQEGRTVYDLETWPDHNFFANNLLVHNCLFCGRVMGRQVRKRSAESLVEEMTRFWKGHFVEFVDDCMTYDREWLFDFCDKSKQAGFHSWGCALVNGTRADCFDQEIFDALRYAFNFSNCMFGLESADSEVLAEIHKETNTDILDKAINVCKRNGMIPGVFMMIGLPKATKAKDTYSMDWVKARQPLFANWSMTSVLPRTALWKWVDRHGKWLQDPRDYFKREYVMYETDDYSKEERLAVIQQAHREVQRT